MSAIKNIRINLANDDVSQAHIYMAENFAVKVIIDYFNTGTQNKEKYVDIRNSNDDAFRYYLGTGEVVEFWLTSEITHSEGVLEINPLAMDDVEVDGEVRRQNIVFPTYKFRVKQSIAAYAEGGPNYDDVIKPMLERLDTIDAEIQDIMDNLDDPDTGLWVLLNNMTQEIAVITDNYENLNIGDVADLALTLSNLQFQIDNIHLVPGPMGPVGPKGEDGADSIVAGPQGIQGEIGPIGPQGLPGPRGDAGPQGEQGIQGIQGDAPNHKWVNTSLQFENSDGSYGDLVNLKGAKGDKGDQGDQGIQGIQGIQGEIGTAHV